MEICQKKTWFALCLLVLLSTFSFGQSEKKQREIQGTEIGADFIFAGDDRGNNFGGGLKFGINLKNYLIVGPVIRYNRLNFLKLSTYYGRTFNSFGGGGFMQLRFAKFLCVGLEVSVNKSPFSTENTVFNVEEGNGAEIGSWAASAFVSGGFSYEIKESIRIEACVMYDVLDLDNSAFYPSYPIYEGGGADKRISIMYQIGVFIPLTRKTGFYE